MSYGVYHTDMIVLEITPSGEASNIYTLLTRELGIVRAKAQSVRKVTSKLRFGLQYLSMGTTDLIRAKDYWRIVGVSQKETLIPKDVYHKPLHRIVSFITRMVPRDEYNRDLYDVLIIASELFSQYKNPAHHEAVEVLSVARILSLCGYWNGELSIYEDVEITEVELDTIVASKKAYVAAINSAIRDTQL